MPFVHIRTMGFHFEQAQVANLQKEAVRLMATILHKKPDLTAVLVDQADSGSWSVGENAVPVAAHLDVKITADTNSVAEKAEFVQQAHALLRASCNRTLPVATYVVIHEIAGDAWGYDGRTQASRRNPASSG
ncbi:4-oxalocrotonate tautomerase [Rhizobium sp. CFBP 8762]|uniref:tautomerase family protein n=1 Tax=Rhizobium sp. CFBP 8762 TaxID=2775279 RepID=UPI00177AFD19|nr:4-oxalocrotonate tautomerase [Rhizobium sp. CFBP 8762]MBD8553206.1 4-oxalocrotonate tautomerase [Rhizobium sp. CFBP 8762]